MWCPSPVPGHIAAAPPRTDEPVTARVFVFPFNSHHRKSHHFLETIHLKETMNEVEFMCYKINASDRYNVQLLQLIMKGFGGNKTLQN